MSAPTTPPEDEGLELAKQAMYLGFITQLTVGGNATKEVTKAAGEGTEEEYTINRADFPKDDVKGIFQKYANTWLPHRMAATEGYYQSILGQAAA